MTARKRKPIDLKTKMEILTRIGSGEKQIEVGKSLGICPQTVCKIWQSQEKIQNAFNTTSGETKKLRGEEKIEDSLKHYALMIVESLK